MGAAGCRPQASSFKLQASGLKPEEHKASSLLPGQNASLSRCAQGHALHCSNQWEPRPAANAAVRLPAKQRLRPEGGAPTEKESAGLRPSSFPTSHRTALVGAVSTASFPAKPRDQNTDHQSRRSPCGRDYCLGTAARLRSSDRYPRATRAAHGSHPAVACSPGSDAG